MMHPEVARRGLEIQGIVQGVGFRPFIHQLAHRFQLAGFVFNHSGGVTIEVEGSLSAIEELATAIIREAPPLSRIEAVEQISLPVQGGTDFIIRESVRGGNAPAAISPDVASCEDCLREIEDPADRRQGYAFTNCTHCGPRYSLITGLPYDRPQTTMAGFPLCPDCLKEYSNPADRRFHAQPVCCPVCGPGVTLKNPAGEKLMADADWLSETVRRLLAGELLAIKGLGGYHLACNPLGPGLTRLRQFKHRAEKPFAMMAASIANLAHFCEITLEERLLLESAERPVLLVASRNHPICTALSPGLDRIGVMLPYTPLHHMLLKACARAGLNGLLMTSANTAGEPIRADFKELTESLGKVLDAIVDHDRPIHARVDDSVIRCDQGQALFLRRSRGFVPHVLKLPGRLSSPPLLATGGDLKNCFALVDGERVIISPYIGDMDDLRCQDLFLETVDHLSKLFRIQPEVVINDAHPGYATRSMTREHFGHLAHLTVHHHPAHVAACLADAGQEPPVLGLAFDGTGYGSDGTIWGSEFIILRENHWQRAAALAPFPLPGGDSAISRPDRTALAMLWSRHGQDLGKLDLPLVRQREAEILVLHKAWSTGLQTVGCSSMGRLFDAAAAILGLRNEISYEGQAAMELEAIAGNQTETVLPDCDQLIETNGQWFLPTIDIIESLRKEFSITPDLPRLAARFHQTIISLSLKMAIQIAHQKDLQTVALTGGCFLNRRLLTGIRQGLESAGLKVISHRLVSPGDGGICLGQAWLADRMLAGGYPEVRLDE